MTSALEQAIKDAVEKGGYLYGRFTTQGDTINYALNLNCEHPTLLDRAFWQALGKARGWNKLDEKHWGLESMMPEWNWNMHRHIDHLAAGGNVEEFFKTLV